MAINSRLDILW